MEKRPTLLEEITQPPLSRELGRRCTAVFFWGMLPMVFGLTGIVAGKCVAEDWVQPLGAASMSLGCAMNLVSTGRLMFKPLPGEVCAREIHDQAMAKQQLARTAIACVLVLAHNLAGVALSTQLTVWGARKFRAEAKQLEKTTQAEANPQLADPELIK